MSTKQIEYKGKDFTYVLPQTALPKIMKAANELMLFASTIDYSYKECPAGPIPDKTLGLKWALTNLKEAQRIINMMEGEQTKYDALLKRVNDLRNLGNYIHVGAIAPDEDVIDAITGKVEKMCERLMQSDEQKANFADLKDFVKTFYGVDFDILTKTDDFALIRNAMRAHYQQTELRLQDMDNVNKELSDERNQLGQFLIGYYEAEGAPIVFTNVSEAAIDAIKEATRQKDDIKAANDRQAETIDGLNRQVSTLKKQTETLAGNLNNFDYLLELVLGQSVANGQNFTKKQIKMLRAIAALND